MKNTKYNTNLQSNLYYILCFSLLSLFFHVKHALQKIFIYYVLLDIIAQYAYVKNI